MAVIDDIQRDPYYNLRAQQWEYCILYMFGKTLKKSGWYCDLELSYCGYSANSLSLSSMRGKNSKPWRYDPWDMAICLLGENGWELISIQHGAINAWNIKSLISLFNAYAYFKRPVIPGRSIYEPKLELPL